MKESVDKNYSVITVSSTNGLDIGDTFYLSTPDQRWWKRLIAWVFNNPRPTKMTSFKVTEISSTTMTIEPK